MTTKPLLPFTPTVDDNDNPTVCRCCGRHAIGIGVGDPKKDPGYLCTECVLLVEHVRSARRMDIFELVALDGGVDAVGEYIESIGGLTELADFDELQRRMLVKAAWQGCADGLRKALKEAPF